VAPTELLQNDARTSGSSFSSKKPVATIRHGDVKIAVWANEGKNGTFYTTSAPNH
jgi:hypothetical protein